VGGRRRVQECVGGCVGVQRGVLIEQWVPVSQEHQNPFDVTYLECSVVRKGAEGCFVV